MEFLGLIGTALGIHLMAVVSPGPDFVVALRNSLTYSRKTGIYTAVGFGLGIGIHVLYCVFGIALLLKESPMVFNIIKYFGGGYLGYIGIMSLIAKTEDIDVGENKKQNDISPLKAIRIGFLTNVLNPKATLFFLSLFTLVITPEIPKHIATTIGVAMMINTTLWFSLVAVFFTQTRIQKTFNKYQKVFNIILGLLLLYLAVFVLFFN